jgi:hypothetical protein
VLVLSAELTTTSREEHNVPHNILLGEKAINQPSFEKCCRVLFKSNVEQNHENSYVHMRSADQNELQCRVKRIRCRVKIVKCRVKCLKAEKKYRAKCFKYRAKCLKYRAKCFKYRAKFYVQSKKSSKFKIKCTE